MKKARKRYLRLETPNGKHAGLGYNEIAHCIEGNLLEIKSDYMVLIYLSRRTLQVKIEFWIMWDQFNYRNKLSELIWVIHGQKKSRN